MLILDTHVWLWWIDQNARLPSWLAAQIADPITPIALSAVSVYELSVGVGRGRRFALPLSRSHRFRSTNSVWASGEAVLSSIAY